MGAKRGKALRIVVVFVRVVLGATFIFSGFVKAVDPWGMALKLNEYFGIFGMEWLSWANFPLSIMLSAFELTLGLALVTGVWRKPVALTTLVFMCGFTIFTAYLAIANPVADCGCFGEVLPLSPINTFLKNIALLAFSVIVWFDSRKYGYVWNGVRYVIIYFIVGCGIGIYSYRHLPMIDLLPYKVGTNLHDLRNPFGADDLKTTLVYKNLATGENREFELSDTTWYDASRWEYVDTKIESSGRVAAALSHSFALFDNGTEVTDEVLATHNRLYLICIDDTRALDPRCHDRLSSFVNKDQMTPVVFAVITGSDIESAPTLELGAREVKCYNMDATTLKTMLRTKIGIIEVFNGVIVSKKNCRDL